ncbi:MAG: AAA family ATPase [Thermoproteota archaeon]
MILLFGVPGTGKTALGAQLSRLLGRRLITVSWLVLWKGLWIGYDKDRRSFIIDEEGFRRALRKLDEKTIVETHWIEPFVDLADRVEALVVTRCDPRVLKKRLERRGWPRRKIAENVEAELLGLVASEVQQMARAAPEAALIEVDTSSRSPRKAALSVLEAIRERRRSQCCIDWMALLGEDAVFSMLSDIRRV